MTVNKDALAITLVVLVIVAGAGIFFWQNSSQTPEQIACTMEAKICPDGSAVGRTGPRCEFAACPGEDINLWQSYTDEKGISFKYPERLTTQYIDAFDWPPKIQFTAGPFTCFEAGQENARAGETELRRVDGRSYCVTKVTGAAAGSMYVQYAYAFPLGDKVPILTFSLRYPNCGNYDEIKMAECEREREAFDIDGVIDRIATSIFVPGSTTQKGSGISGTVLIGPTCPVMQYPPDPECDDRPYATRLSVTTSDGARVIKEFNSDVNGRFSVALPPGQYAIRSAAAANVLPYCASEVFTVDSNAYTAVSVSCDSGIR